MAQSFSMAFGIDPKELDERGIFDPILGVDTRLFIDPFLLPHSKAPELTGSGVRLQQHFEDILELLVACESENDTFWRQAKQLLLAPEVHGLSIGYSEGDSGSGTGRILADRLLRTAFQIVKKGTVNPRLFELTGLFEQDFGPDRISDMTAKIIAPDLYAYTTRVCEEMGVPATEIEFPGINSSAFLPINSDTKRPIILVPKDVLRNLPIAMGWSDVNQIAVQNAELRRKINKTVGDSWREATLRLQKDTLKKMLIENPELVQDLLAQYVSKQPEVYDFEKDPTGEVIWFRVTRKFSADHPLELKLSASPSVGDVYTVVQKICLRFRDLIEKNQLCNLLYNESGESKHERAAQLLFYGIADAYCAANNIMIAREPNAGRGPVDFKFGIGYSNSVLVEVKLTANKQLLHGYTTQLPIYKNAEGTKRGIYLVIENGGLSDTRRREFKATVAVNIKNDPEVIWVDGILKSSASVAKH